MNPFNFTLIIFLISAFNLNLAIAKEIAEPTEMNTTMSKPTLESDIDSFGGNETLYMKAKALNPDINNNIIQNRVVDRSYRFEVAPEFSGVYGTDAYTKSQSAGLNVYYHLGQHFSLSAKYSSFFNSLTPEGAAQVDRANSEIAANPSTPKFLFPQIIFPKSETLGLINWYPVAGKLSFGSLGVAHFDLYMLAGYGNIQLSNGSSPMSALGGGIGFWTKSKFTTRVEYRAQNYNATYYDERRSINSGVASIQMGYIL